MPVTKEEINREVVGPELLLPPGASILVADDSHVARSVIELALKAMGAPFIMAKTGKAAWEQLLALADQAKADGSHVRDRVAVVLTDLEMPEMDGFTPASYTHLDVYKRQGQLSKTTQQNASASEELAATSEEMSDQAEQLQQSIAFFYIGGDAPTVSDRFVSKPSRNRGRAPSLPMPSARAVSQRNFKPY